MIVAMSFDATAANTGHKSGACTLLKQKLGRPLPWLARRHRIQEIVCAEVFKAIFGPTSGAQVELFHLFQAYWPKVDPTMYKPCSDSRLNRGLLSLKAEAITFSRNVLSAESRSIPRDGYKESTLIFLGEILPHGVFLQAPGTFHHARWMSTLVCSA